jgi:hypothetical protein
LSPHFFGPAPRRRTRAFPSRTRTRHPRTTVAPASRPPAPAGRPAPAQLPSPRSGTTARTAAGALLGACPAPMPCPLRKWARRAPPSLLHATTGVSGRGTHAAELPPLGSSCLTSAETPNARRTRPHQNRARARAPRREHLHSAPAPSHASSIPSPTPLLYPSPSAVLSTTDTISLIDGGNFVVFPTQTWVSKPRGYFTQKQKEFDTNCEVCGTIL